MVRSSRKVAGTVEQIDNPVISYPDTSELYCNQISSEVVRGSVLTLHERINSLPLKMPSTVFVFPTSTVNNMATPLSDLGQYQTRATNA